MKPEELNEHEIYEGLSDNESKGSKSTHFFVRNESGRFVPSNLAEKSRSASTNRFSKRNSKTPYKFPNISVLKHLLTV